MISSRFLFDATALMLFANTMVMKDFFATDSKRDSKRRFEKKKCFDVENASRTRYSNYLLRFLLLLVLDAVANMQSVSAELFR